MSTPTNSRQRGAEAATEDASCDANVFVCMPSDSRSASADHDLFAKGGASKVDVQESLLDQAIQSSSVGGAPIAMKPKDDLRGRREARRRSSLVPIEVSDAVMHQYEHGHGGVLNDTAKPKMTLKRVMTLMTQDFTHGEEGHVTVGRAAEAMTAVHPGSRIGDGAQGEDDNLNVPARSAARRWVDKFKSGLTGAADMTRRMSPKLGSADGSKRSIFGSSKKSVLSGHGNSRKSVLSGSDGVSPMATSGLGVDIDQKGSFTNHLSHAEIASLARKAANGHDIHPTGGIKRAFGYNSKPLLKHGHSETKAYSERDMSDQLHGATQKKHDCLDVNVPLHPYSYVRMLWDGLMFILTVFALVSDPLTIAFEAESADGGDWKEILDRIFTSFFCLDIVLNFMTGHADEKNLTVIMNVCEVAKIYCKTWLIVDVCSSLPPEAFSSFQQNSMLKGARLSKLLRCFKISRLARLVQVLQLNFDIRLSQFLWKIIAWLSLCILYLHWATCAQIMVWRATVNADNSRTSVFLSIDQPGIDGAIWGGDDECLESSACCSRLYLRALRSATAYMCGHGQETGPTFEEDILAVVATLTGSVLYTSFIAVAMSFILEMDARRVKHMSKVELLNHYLGRRFVPLPLRMRIRKYMELVWEAEGGAQEEESLGIVSSRSLRRELTRHNTSGLLMQVPFFSSAPAGFLTAVGECLKHETFLEGDDLIQEGEVGHEMFIIEKGIVQVLDSNHMDLAHLGPGSYFGEIALTEPTIRTVTMRAMTDGVAYTLSRENLSKFIDLFPQQNMLLERATRDLKNRGPVFTHGVPMRQQPPQAVGRREWFKRTTSPDISGHGTPKSGPLKSPILGMGRVGPVLMVSSPNLGSRTASGEASGGGKLENDSPLLGPLAESRPTSFGVQDGAGFNSAPSADADAESAGVDAGPNAQARCLK